METNKKTTYNFYRLFAVDQPLPKTIGIDIWMSRADQPPTRKDESVIKHCSLEWQAKFQWTNLHIVLNSRDEKFYELEFRVDMGSSGDVTDVNVVHKGNRVARSNVRVEFHDRGILGA